MFTTTHRRLIALLLVALLAGALLLSACSPAAPTITPAATATTAAPTATTEPTKVSAPTMTTAPTATAAPTMAAAPSISLDTGGMAAGFETETVAAVSAGSNAPYWEILPAYTRATLQGYPVSDHLMQPQIFIYPVAELEKANEGAAQIVASLRTLLQSPQEIPNMPFLPLFNASQVMHTHVQYLDFKSGQGLRYLTTFAQGIVPINNGELIYTYQGLTSDGKYYVAAVLPVGHPSLPADARVTGKEPPEFVSDFPAYVSKVARALNQEAGDTFTPSLIQLDAMLSSLEVK